MPKLQPKIAYQTIKVKERQVPLLGENLMKFFFSASNGIGNFFLPRKIRTIWSPSPACGGARH
ncbi:hypothetical protein A3G55_03725 [Candidatus Giovannonibacteria bacterium RIFCSPLOWO2_12_FULL_44_25]|uniref:Uncharacterized protein n=1 Tax=Candidatus Giovannonibacteria bacterium RIFCSPHIGHO2_02_FULL_45_40 TaxID=1798337 RepID=A0A1F5WB09_9BACT|nr:MAG: hypothetical protein A2656_01410 [Candidatus Giovannonibacteria bacterium RIFCSPHIGHO2_01_FULL_44_100]OGF72823.1 MAG: hypothetical protein A3C05_05175 [Candidatus Giovannonibacteria bacterium RIFCSPHIGHO2_02_FULL_45_40]OGF84092.1 MAG: hypothetical protein A3E63_01855 [Candidatus Giovannonibacteria bacterium RIFCSPHIGHO2_12_FULL_45_19]OGF85274.1 MAG: hypothetical protein A3A19_00990 [Candidatus Giovannonibacteria bacterium RIFCSPLOWO2_01_FULL_45_140]OGF88201.1 MAG: hypothetical protein A